MLRPFSKSHQRTAITGLALGVLASPLVSRADDGEVKRLPTEFKTPAARIDSVAPSEKHVAAWKTEHFLLLSDAPIPPAALQQFATTIESVPKVLEALPLPLLGMPSKGHPIIRLCRDEQRFTQLGGPPSSAGFYQNKTQTVLIRADLFLNPQRGGNSILAQAPEEDLLVHELCHLATASTLGYAPVWLSEGFAEYLSTAHQKGGHYRFNNSAQFIRQHFAKHLALKDLTDLELPSLSHVLGLSHHDWSRDVAISDPADRYLPYATSLLYLHYYLEGGNERRQALESYLIELKKPHPRHQAAPELGRENLAEVEKRLVKFWSTRGIKIRFVDSEG